MVILAPPRRYILWHPRVRRVLWGSEQSSLAEVWWLDAPTERFNWSRMRGAFAFFVRPLWVSGVQDDATVMAVEAERVSHDVLSDFRPAVQAASARAKSGEAGNLIFLAQLTPVSWGAS